MSILDAVVVERSLEIAVLNAVRRDGSVICAVSGRYYDYREMKHFLPGNETPRYRDLKHFLPGNETHFGLHLPGNETLFSGISA